MTKSERGFALIVCVGGGMIAYAGYLASTGGDLILALIMLTFGTIPFIVHFLKFELKLGLKDLLLLGTLWTLAVPTSVGAVSLLLSFRWEQDSWFILPVLHWGAIVLTGLIGVSTLIILLLVAVDGIQAAIKSNRRPSVM